MSGKQIMNKQYTFTIFGGTGDLTYRKLLPALYNIYVGEQSTQFRIVIIGRRDYTKEAYCTIIHSWIQQFARLSFKEEAFASFCERLYYYRMDFTNQAAYIDLNAYYKQHGMQHPIFYFAVAPHFFEKIAKGLMHVDGAAKGRVVIEKPFGRDLASARLLDTQLNNFFTAKNIYHIDHYLGKEMVRNIQAIRFTNPIFTNIWNHNFIEHVQISAMEEVGVETRGGYYDSSGALKDMVQNHLFQIMSIVAMEPMDQYTKEDMHQKQLAVLNALRPVEELDIADAVVLGQYEGYRNEDKVAHDSTTETYAALRLFIDNERWRSTPFYIRTGKKLNRREMEVIITFKRAMENVENNVLIIKIQPTEGVYVRFNIKKPGNSEEIVATTMDFCQSCLDINRINTPEAYERLLMAVVEEDASWFSQWDQIEASWNYIDKLKAQVHKASTLVPYEVASSGPKEADALLQRHGHAWENLL